MIPYLLRMEFIVSVFLLSMLIQNFKEFFFAKKHQQELYLKTAKDFNFNKG